MHGTTFPIPHAPSLGAQRQRAPAPTFYLAQYMVQVHVVSYILEAVRSSTTKLISN